MSNTQYEDAVRNLGQLAKKLNPATEIKRDGTVIPPTKEIDEDLKTINQIQKLFHQNLKIKDEPQTWKDSESFETIRSTDGGPFTLILTTNESIRLGNIKELTSITAMKKEVEDSSLKQKLSAKLWECTHCTKTFASGSSLSRHKKICNKKDEEREAISGVKTSLFPCLFPMCGQEFGRKSSLSRHVLLKHSQIKMFICKTCQRAFALAADLARHEKSVHAKEGVQCSTCGALLSRRDNLNRHETTGCLKQCRSEDEVAEDDLQSWSPLGS